MPAVGPTLAGYLLPVTWYSLLVTAVLPAVAVASSVPVTRPASVDTKGSQGLPARAGKVFPLQTSLQRWFSYIRHSKRSALITLPHYLRTNTPGIYFSSRFAMNLHGSGWSPLSLRRS